MKRAVGLHPDRQDQRARDAFVELRGAADAAGRAAQIAALPTVIWKGRTLRTIRCHGTTGKGPHDVHVPDAVLWALIDLRAYCCPYHQGSWGPDDSLQ